MSPKKKEIKEAKTWASSRILVFSFLTIILVGTVLLMLPQAVNGNRLSFIDSLFTATSATCVTGLTVVDTGTKFTHFGQMIILILIQLGGLGIMTFSTFFVFLVFGKFSISDRDIIQNTITQSPIKNIAGLLKSIFLFTILIELAGAVLLTLFFAETIPLPHALYHGLFHSISAFCNAGFSLFDTSLVNFQGNFKVNSVFIMLIISGGLGFVVLYELKSYMLKSKDRFKFSFHSKIVIRVSLILLLVGAGLFFLLEYKNILQHRSLQDKFLISLFQSVTCRTAGFNTVDISLLTHSSLFIMIILMFIGASPGSCGGGIKTTTVGILMAMLVARFQNKEDVNISRRRMPNEIISRAISVTFFSVALIIIAVTLLMIAESGGVSYPEHRGLFLETLFEVISAFGTVGLSTGLTSGLTSLGKFIIIITMFVGRIGPLTIALAIGKKETPRFKYAQEKVLIG